MSHDKSPPTTVKEMAAHFENMIPKDIHTVGSKSTDTKQTGIDSTKMTIVATGVKTKGGIKKAIESKTRLKIPRAAKSAVGFVEHRNKMDEDMEARAFASKQARKEKE